MAQPTRLLTRFRNTTTPASVRSGSPRKALPKLATGTTLGFWQPVGFPCADYGSWLRLALHGRAAFDPTTVAMWRRHEGQATDEHAVAIAEGAFNTAISFLNSLSPEQRANLGLTPQDILDA